MRFDPILPKIDPAVANTVLREIGGNTPEYHDIWAKDMLARVKLHDPVFAKYLAAISHLPNAPATALIVYRMFETQLEVDQLEEQGKL